MAPDLFDFVAHMRRAGVPASPDRVQLLFRSLDAAGVDLLYWAGRLSLCGSPTDIARYDQAFAGFVDGPDPAGTPFQLRRLPERALFQAARGNGDGGAGEPGLAVQASDVEVLRHRDIASLSAVE